MYRYIGELSIFEIQSNYTYYPSHLSATAFPSLSSLSLSLPSSRSNSSNSDPSPNSNLNLPSGVCGVVYQIELLGFEKGIESWQLSPEARVGYMKQRKDQGSNYYNQKRYILAEKKYNQV